MYAKVITLVAVILALFAGIVSNQFHSYKQNTQFELTDVKARYEYLIDATARETAIYVSKVAACEAKMQTNADELKATNDFIDETKAENAVLTMKLKDASVALLQAEHDFNAISAAITAKPEPSQVERLVVKTKAAKEAFANTEVASN